MKPVIFGSFGLGGYADTVCRLLMEHGARPDPVVRLAAVCEPDGEKHAERGRELRAAGIDVMTGWEDLLARPVEAVWLPLPVPLHRLYTERALAAGKAVLCEKPAAGCIQDLDAMLDARNRARLPVAVGFQDIYEPTTLALKRAMVGGEIGTVRRATLTACWPRDSRYYGRSPWAGRQRMGKEWVLDSPAMNALAHFLTLALFLAGDADSLPAQPARVEAELYRANPIENYDTCALRLHTTSGIEILVFLTHACRGSREPRLVFHGERGTLTYLYGDQAEIVGHKGVRTHKLNDGASRAHIITRFARLVRGEWDERPVATLEVARAHLVAVNGASEATPVQNVPAEWVDVFPQDGHGELRAIRGIEELFARCAQEGCLPNETGQAAWTVPAGRRDLHGYNFFRGPASN